MKVIEGNSVYNYASQSSYDPTYIHIHDLKLSVTSVTVHVRAGAFHFSEERKSKRKEEIDNIMFLRNQLDTTSVGFQIALFATESIYIN